MGIGYNQLIDLCQFWVAPFPAEPQNLTLTHFSKIILVLLQVIGIYIGHKLWTRNWNYIKVQI